MTQFCAKHGMTSHQTLVWQSVIKESFLLLNIFLKIGKMSAIFKRLYGYQLCPHGLFCF